MNNSTYRRSFRDIMNDVVDAMPVPVVTIYTVTPVPGSPYTWALFVEDMYYTAYNQPLIIGGKQYTVKNLSDGFGKHTITVYDPTLSLSAPVPGTFNLYQFYFYHGTPIDTNTELGEIKNANSKYPIIWLWEEFSEEMDWDLASAIDRKTTCKLYFLDQSDPKLGPTDNRWTMYLEPMYKFRDYFMNYLQTQRQDFMIWDQKTVDKPKSRFGIWMTNKGVTEALFADNLAGVESGGTFTVYKNAQSFNTTFP